MDAALFPISERGATLARLGLGLTSPLVALCIVTLAARFYVRARPTYKLGWDDWCILLGTVRASESFACSTHPLSQFSKGKKEAFPSIPVTHTLYFPNNRLPPAQNSPSKTSH